MEKEYFSTNELAHILGVSRQAVFKRIKSGRIKAVKVGRNFIIPKQELPIILGNLLPERSKESIEKLTKRLVSEHGETFRLLAKE